MGFDAGDRDLPVPPIEVDSDTRDRLALTLIAVVHGATPEEVADYLEDDFPVFVSAALERPGERDEIDAHVNLLLAVLQSPPVAAAA